MERMCEAVKDSEYFATQHFISESPWEHQEVMDQTALNVSERLQSTGKKVALLIDESGHAKKGDKSVGVSRQYSGTLGKVDNCQVAVYCALSADKYYSIVDAALFLPKEWTDNKKRCDKAGIPSKNQRHKSKLALALEMIKHQKQIGVAFDYVAGDGLYGNNYALMESLSELGITAIFDVHEDQYIYTSAPNLFIPEDKNTKGRKPTRTKTDSKALTVKAFHSQLAASAFTEVTIRKGTKGTLKSKAVAKKIYTWDGHSTHYNERILLIRVTQTGDNSEQIKYSLTNAHQDALTLEELVEMQAQRYFIERSFQESKQDIGLSDYQVRGWRAWHHHIALCIMAQGYILEEKLLCKDEMPLLSAFDVRQVIINTYAKKNDTYEEVERQIKLRHQQRKVDMERRRNV